MIVCLCVCRVSSCRYVVSGRYVANQKKNIKKKENCCVTAFFYNHFLFLSLPSFTTIFFFFGGWHASPPSTDASPSPPSSLTHVHSCIGYRNPTNRHFMPTYVRCIQVRMTVEIVLLTPHPPRPPVPQSRMYTGASSSVIGIPPTDILYQRP